MLKIKTIERDGKLSIYLGQLADLKARAVIGFFPDAGKYKTGESVATVAYKNETGANGIPRRPFMARTVKVHNHEWLRGIRHNLTGGKLTRARIRHVCDLYGQVAQGDIKRTIADWPDNDPRKNSPATIARKAKRAKKANKGIPINPTRALIDTGKMIRSVDYRVEMGKS